MSPILSLIRDAVSSVDNLDTVIESFRKGYVDDVQIMIIIEI